MKILNITDEVHKNLSVYKATNGHKTFDDAIRQLLEDSYVHSK